MAARKKAKKKAKVLGDFDYRIDVVEDYEGTRRVVIVGKNGGTIRGKGGKWVTFSRGEGVARFKIACTELDHNDDPSAPDAWPFELPMEDGWLPSFRRKLIKPEKGASLLIFKYSIIVEDAIAADPAIIIDKR
jgi:hypothetical protein